MGAKASLVKLDPRVLIKTVWAFAPFKMGSSGFVLDQKLGYREFGRVMIEVHLNKTGKPDPFATVEG